MTSIAAASTSERSTGSAMRRFLMTFIRFFVGLIAAQSAIGALVLLGYLYRRMRGHSLAVWSQGQDPFHAPGWFAAEHHTDSLPRRMTGSLVKSFRLGITAVTSVAIIVLPSGALMAMSWYAGWNNSFNKGYEYAAIGPAMGFAGIGLGMLTLCYLPFAQARHATTGDWHVLFHWRTNIGLASCRMRGLFLLPFASLVPAMVVFAARGLLTFAPRIPAFAGLEADPQRFLSSWFFWWAVPFILSLFWLKRLTANTYAHSVLTALKRGRIGIANLHSEEQMLLHKYPPTLGTPDKIPANRPLMSDLWRVLLPMPLWFPVFGLLYVQQFVNYRGAWGWINNPFMWLPLVGYTP